MADWDNNSGNGAPEEDQNATPAPEGDAPAGGGMEMPAADDAMPAGDTSGDMDDHDHEGMNPDELKRHMDEEHGGEAGGTDSTTGGDDQEMPA